MKLLTKKQRERLLANGRKMAERDISGEVWPVVKLFTPDAGATWLLAWLDHTDTDVAWGLCDLGVGCPEIGTVMLSEIEAVRGRLGMPVERDLHFKADKSLLDYARVARDHRRIVA